MGSGPNIEEEMQSWPLGPGLGPCISSSIFGPKPIQILQFPASQLLEAAQAPNLAPRKEIPFLGLCEKM